MRENSSTRVEFHLDNVCKVLVDPVDQFDSFVISNVDHQREVYSRGKSERLSNASDRILTD